MEKVGKTMEKVGRSMEKVGRTMEKVGRTMEKVGKLWKKWENYGKSGTNYGKGGKNYGSSGVFSRSSQRFFHRFNDSPRLMNGGESSDSDGSEEMGALGAEPPAVTRQDLRAEERWKKTSGKSQALVAKLLQIGKICAILIHFGDLFHIT